ncbi:MAG: LuxR C-terminal-related transcriptional regulator [Paracoccaceae bacterium]
MVSPPKIGFSIGTTQRILKRALLLVLLAQSIVYAQFAPVVQNYSPEQYGADNQNWAIDQSKQGLLFVANQSRVLLFDGKKWESFFVPNAQSIRSIKVIGDRLYVGGAMSIGFYEITPQGLENYSEIEGLEHQNIDVGEEFWHIAVLDERLFFQSKRAIYEVIENQLIRRAPFESDRPESFRNAGELYFFSSNKAIRFSSGEHHRFEFPELSSALIGAYEFNSKLFFVNENGETFSLKENDLVRENSPFVDLQNSGQIYDLLQLKDGQLVVGTIALGMRVYGKRGQLRYVLDKKNGLNNSTVLGLFQSNTGRVWAALDQGLASFESNSNLSEFRSGIDDIGVVYTAVRHDNKLYIGTNQGLYLYSEKEDRFNFVLGTRGQVWNLTSFGDQLFCFHDKGLFEVRGLESALLDSRSGYWNASRHISSEGVLSYVLGGYDGVYIYRPNSDPKVNKIDTFNVPSRFVEVVNNTIVVNHESLGVFILDIDWNQNKIRSEKRIPALGTASSLFVLGDKLYYKSSEGVFNVENHALRYDRTLTGLLADPILRPAQNSAKADEISFLSTNKMIRLKALKAGTYDLIEEMLPEARLSSFGVSGFENINAIGRQEHLIGLKDGFLIVGSTANAEQIETFPVWPLSLEVARQDDFVSLPLDETPLLNAQESTIRVKYRHPSFSDRYPTEYQFQLISKADTVVDRALVSTKTYYNLKPGRYSLSVIAFGQSNKILAKSEPLGFEIDKPWYQTTQFTLYVIFSGLLIFFIASAMMRVIYKRREQKIRKENERLLETNQLREENRISQLKNKHLEDELEIRKRELTGVYEAEIRRNALLKDLKAQIGKAISEKPAEEIKALIDKHLEDDSDWTKFESAFNELDFDFMANLNKRHQGLTRQEVRLLVYIRLNLSNKEISDLLNIGLKSVEMKRYRVRKKLGLEKSQNLSEYIHSF